MGQMRASEAEKQRPSSGRYGLGISDRLSLDGPSGYDLSGSGASGGLFGGSYNSIFTGESYEVAGGGSGLGLRDGSDITTYALGERPELGAPIPIAPPDNPEQRAYDLERLDYQSRFGQPGDSYDQMLASYYGDGALAEGRSSMRAFWGGLQDDAAASGSFLKYAGAGMMGWLGDVGYSAAEMGAAMYDRPGSATLGALKAATLNFGPDAFNGLTNLTKTSLNGFSLLAESTFAPEGTFAGFRDSDPYNISLLAPYANQAEGGGALLANLGMGVGLAKYGGYNVRSPIIPVGAGELGSMGIKGFQAPFIAPELSISDDLFAAAAGPNGKTYSVAFQTQLKPGSYPGVSRGRHFQESNENLLRLMESDATYAQSIRGLGIDIQRTPTGLAPRTSPSGWTWHHAPETGVMQLVPRSQHAPGSIFWDTLHPGGVGGYSIWGGG